MLCNVYFVLPISSKFHLENIFTLKLPGNTLEFGSHPGVRTLYDDCQGVVFDSQLQTSLRLFDRPIIHTGFSVKYENL